MKFFKLLSIKRLNGLIVIGVISITISCKQEKSHYTTLSSAEGMGQIPDSIDFSFHIKPILSDRCFTCHGPDKNAIEAGLSLNKAEDAYAPLGENKDRYAIVPGNLDQSELIKRIYEKDPNLIMPPPESNLSLSNYEKELLKKWVEQKLV